MTIFATSNRNNITTHMEQKNTRENTEMGEVINNTELFIEKNKKKIIALIVAILVIVLAIFGISKISQSRNAKANAELYAAEQWFAADEWQMALDGNENHAGFLEVAKKYGCTPTGRRAKYEAGVCYLQLGQYNEALNMLKKYKGKDQLTAVKAVICMGDAEAELGNSNEALKLYEKAAKMNENFLTAPEALFKAGMVCLTDGNNAKAAEYFNQIKRNYPESTEFSTIDKYIGVAEAE